MINKNLFVSFAKMAVCLLSALVVVSCKNGGNGSGNIAANYVEMEYAKGLRIMETDDYSVVEVVNPWDTTAVLHKYVLVDESKKEIKLPEGTVVVVPVKDVAVYSSVHASIIDHLGKVSSIKGVCETEYMAVESVKQGLAENTISDYGSTMSPNVEKMIEDEVKAVVATPFMNGTYGVVETLGIPIVEGADYMEVHPLGRTEWIKFYSRLFGAKELGDSLFNEAKGKYNQLKEFVQNNRTKSYDPTVMSEKKYGAQWNVPGGKSYMSTLFKDAGGDYIFKDDNSTGSLTLSLEAMIEEGVKSDMCLIKYNAAQDLTYGQLVDEFSPYQNFKAFKNRKIYGCNSGNVNYYEEATMHPYLLLENFIMIFHPDMLKDGQMRYFTPIK